jgi:hypothetical protein
MSKGKAIDYLVEDQPIPNQKYALISIVGPNMRQKCDVWGLKVRGVADSLDSAKVLTKKIMKYDKDYDIYTVDVGKFFPLAVEPYDVSNVEYENEQLNALVKNYLENKEKANEHWHQRKQEMMKEAIREGQVEGQKELASKPEHPIAVLQRIKNFETSINEINEKLENLRSDLQLSKDKFNSYTQEERDLADAELKKAIENNVDTSEQVDSQKSIEDIRKEIMYELQEEESQSIDVILSEIKKADNEIEEIQNNLNVINKETAPSIFSTLTEKLNKLQISRDNLKQKLNQSNSVNNFINSNYNEGAHDSLFH